MSSTKKQSTKARLFAHIADYNGVTSIGIASQVLDLSCETVRKHFKSLCEEGRCCFGWDDQALALTVEELGRQQQIKPMDVLCARMANAQITK